MTTPTAISNFNTENEEETKFKKFINYCQVQHQRLCIILDEAHHAPAHGCRNLLLGIRKIIPNHYLLGLTATPTYNDQTQRGWLSKIFDQRVIYQSNPSDLQAQHILAKAIFIEMPTGKEYEVDDALYTRLMREHKELPEYIVDKLANDAKRNDYIINEYLINRKKYGKTIIFADRWFQCVYFKERLDSHGIKVDAIYSYRGIIDDTNIQRIPNDNMAVLKQFKNGNLDVLINVRMLTEGTDVPSVRTVFITRQTTSSILMTQMVGRALRGMRAGGEDTANIVLFVDKWKRLISWAPIPLDGGTNTSPQVVRGNYPQENISERLIEELTMQINFPDTFPNVPFIQTLPTGWFLTEVVVNTSEGSGEEMQSFKEFVMIYEHTKPKFDDFIDFVFKALPWDERNMSMTMRHVCY